MEGLTPKQQKALDALLRGCTQEAAAREAGVHRRTLERWIRQNAAFQQALRDAERDALARVSRRLAALADSACDALAQALAGNAAAAQVRAADVVLGRLMTLRELVDLEARVSALEGKHELEGKNPTT